MAEILCCLSMDGTVTVNKALQRSRGEAGLGFRDGDLARLHQRGAAKALLPRTHSSTHEAVLVNTAGGITGGDRYDYQCEAAASRVVVTTQAAERAYRSSTDDIAGMDVRLAARRGAALHWLPQETILFDHGALDRTLTVEMTADSRLLAVESLILGRSAMGETLTNTHLRDRIRIRRDDDLIFADTLRLDSDTLADLPGTAMLNGAGAMASVLFAAPEAEAHLPPLRDLMPDTGGVSLIRPGLLFARILASDGFVLRQSLIPVLTHLNGANLPRTWMI